MINDDSTCPICKSIHSKIIDKNYIYLAKCTGCGIIFNRKYQQLNYDDTYFTSQYKEQYGKTYIEDFENIYSISLSRIKKILKFLKIKKKLDDIQLLDIGSAMGFFLKAAFDYGIKNILGIEISGFAARYCREKLHTDVIKSSFHDVKLHHSFDIITAWYFLEHCYNPLSVIEKVFNFLEPNGIFAFSTPSFFGPQYLFNRNDWVRKHPIDHRIDLSPAIVKKILKTKGFSRIITYPGGIHPERIFSENSFIYKTFKPAYTILSRLTSFSDTMEIYAVK